MSKRGNWSLQEDKALIYFKENLKLSAWSEIFQRFKINFGTEGRNEKECQQRYCNHLDPSVKLGKITTQEEGKLFKLYDEIGNKWTIIAQNFKGRTGNQIKSFFHSKLRKSIRKLNNFIQDTHYNDGNIYHLKIVSNIVEACNLKLDATKNQQNQLNFCLNLKSQLLEYIKGKNNQSLFVGFSSKQICCKLILDLNNFQKIYLQIKSQQKDKLQIEKKLNQTEQKYSDKREYIQNHICILPMPANIETQKSKTSDKNSKFESHILKKKQIDLSLIIVHFDANEQEDMDIEQQDSNDQQNRLKKMNFVNGSDAENDEDIAMLLKQTQIGGFFIETIQQNWQ